MSEHLENARQRFNACIDEDSRRGGSYAVVNSLLRSAFEAILEHLEAQEGDGGPSKDDLARKLDAAIAERDAVQGLVDDAKAILQVPAGAGILRWAEKRMQQIQEARRDLEKVAAELNQFKDRCRDLKAQLAKAEPEKVDWREGDLVRWERGEEMVQGRLMRHPCTCLLTDDGLLRIKTNDGFLHRPAAECTIVKRADE